MNVIQIVKPFVTNIVSSEAGKAMVTVGKNVVKAGLKGFGFGATVGGFLVSMRIGYRITEVADNTILKPLHEILKNQEAGVPQYTVTFCDVKQEKTEENVPEAKPEEA